MEHSDLIFSFVITVEELKSLVQCKQFVIKSEFADIFSIILNCPETKKRKQKKLSKNKNKAKITKDSIKSTDAKPETRVGQSILYVGNIDVLMLHMMQYPMEICLCRTSSPEERVGSTLIPWHPALIEYLMSLYQDPNPTPPHVSVVHNVFNEVTSKRMAVLRLSIKLRLIESVCWDRYKVLSRKHPHTFILTDKVDPGHYNRSTATIVTAGPGVIKTIYSGGKNKKKSITNKSGSKRSTHIAKVVQDRHETSPNRAHHNDDNVNKINRTILNFTRSDTDVAKTERVHLVHSKSCTAVKRIHPFDYLFGDRNGPFGSKVYTVGYFTVDEPKAKAPSSQSTSPQTSHSPGLSSKRSPINNSGSLDSNITVTVKCQSVDCEHKKERPLLEAPDDRVLLDLTSLRQTCCVTESVQRKIEVIDTVDPCYCACECSFGFEKKTTYCHICKGYEKLTEDLDGTPRYLMPDPCPIYHKIKVKTGSTSGSETKKESKKRVKSSELEKKKGNDDRFKFNYGYKGIPPQIGHSRCVLPCTGTISNVPKYMGWLWTADNIPGLMFRPAWKPGAINKVVARMLRMAKHPGAVISKRRKTAVVKKRIKRPLLVVHKQDGEYTVTMETMKSYAKPRTFNQQPYEDKPVLTYTIGRTEEENLERKRKKERASRRLEREQRDFIQSAFRDMCKDICLKTYQQALGILPDAEDPECSCFPALPGPDQINLDRSCSCSDGEDSLASDTDSDEWILEFTPPNAYFDPQYSDLKVKTVDKETQYTYLDYRVKIVDRFGNPVPRFFKGLDGKQQCSDLGGFWSPDHKWLEINVDGYIAPDGRWAPLTFIGPSGEQVDTDTGKFQVANGQWLVVGVDGYIDSNNRWKFYKYTAKAGQSPSKKKYTPLNSSKKRKDVIKAVTKTGFSEPTFSCFGDATPVELCKMGIVGHGSDKRVLNRVLKDLIAKGVTVTLPQAPKVSKTAGSRRSRTPRRSPEARDAEKFKCRHRSPSGKGVSRDRDGIHYFRKKKYQSRSSIMRIHDLEQQGKSMSAFHEPCFHSDMNYENRPRRRRVQIVKNVTY